MFDSMYFHAFNVVIKFWELSSVRSYMIRNIQEVRCACVLEVETKLVVSVDD